MIVQGVGTFSGTESTAARTTRDTEKPFSLDLTKAIEEKRETLKAIAEAITPEMLTEMAEELVVKKEQAATLPGGKAPDLTAKYFRCMGDDFNLMLLRSIYEMYNSSQKVSTPDVFTA